MNEFPAVIRKSDDAAIGSILALVPQGRSEVRYNTGTLSVACKATDPKIK